MTDTPTCPACEQPWIGKDGKFRICTDCPYREAEINLDFDDREAAPGPKRTDDDRMTVIVHVAPFLRYLTERERRIRELEREIAELRFKSTDTE